MIIILFQKPKKLTSDFFNNDKEILDDLGLKSDLSDWNCYDVLNVPGKISKSLLKSFFSIICIIV